MKKIITLIMLLAAVTLQSQEQKISEELTYHSNNPDEHAHNCGVDNSFDPVIHQNLTTPIDASAISYIWPFDEALDDGILLVNYVDNLNGNGIKDYNDDNWAYDGHNGTDLSVHNFRSMDRFVGVRAAATGTVVRISVSYFDRNTELNNGIPANLVQIRHSDGTYAFYYHLMKNSVTVKLGEYVLQGQLIGYVGSSGNSTGPHLHFEPGYYSGNTWVKRDPWSGYYNQLPSLWQDQLPYVGFTAFKLHDMGVYTAGLVGGNFNNTWDYVSEGIIQPNTISGYESKIGFWMLVQGNYSGKSIKFEMRKSDGTLFDDYSFSIPYQVQGGFYRWTPDFNPGIGVTGNWYVRVLYDNMEKGRCFFNVQLLPSSRPRMYPVAAKCFRRSALTQRDTLRVRPVRTGMQYDLLNAPSNVTLTNDSIINISAFNQTYRTREFKVIASIGGNATLRDTMIYKLIDTTKGNFVGNGVESLELTAKIEGFWDGSSMNEDTVTVLLRAPLSPYNIVDSTKILLNNNGYALVNFLNINPGIYYYLVIKHRNSIETWSKSVMQFVTSNPITYDFTTSSTKAYGNNLKFKSSDYCIFGGDVDQDGSVNLTDVIEIFNASLQFAFGYKVADVTGNNFINLDDVILAYNNSNAFVTKKRP